MSFFPLNHASPRSGDPEELTTWAAFGLFLSKNPIPIALLFGMLAGMGLVVDAKLAVGGMIGLLVVGLSFRFPGFILSALLTLMLFQRFQMIQFGILGVPLSLAKISALLAIGVLIAHALVRRQNLIALDGVSAGLLAITAAFLISTLAADDPGDSRRRMMSMVVLSTLTYFTYRFVRREHVKLLLTFLPFILALLCAVSFWDVANGGVWSRATEIVDDNEVIRGSGSFGDPNVWASVNLFFMPLMLYHFSAAKRKWIKAMDVIVLMGLVVNVALSFSRAGYLAFGILALAVFWQQRKRPGLIVLGGAVVLGVLAAVVPFDVIEQRFNRLSIAPGASGRASSLYLRYQVLVGGVEVFLDNPLWGVGPGQYSAYVSYGGLADFGKTSHNIYVQILVELGILGTVAFLILFRGAFQALRRLLKTLKPGHPDRALALALGLSFFAYAMMGVTLNILYHSYMWFMLGVALSMVNWEPLPELKDEDGEDEAQVKPHPAVTLPLSMKSATSPLA